ncbi:MAG TPA: glycosyltransferase family 4 protein, partial [Burkholderiales bacterium]|nr:glycosyltransferase family 4 protein [Burkholderiales bacterium]
MRVLIVTQYFWPENFRINDLAQGLIERGHRVTVLTGLPNYPAGRFFDNYGFGGPYREDHDGVDVVRVPLIPRGNGGGFQLALNYVAFALAGAILGPLRCRGEFDAILVYEPSPITVGIPAVALRALKRVPLLFWVQDLWPESLSATGAIKSQWVMRLVATLVRFLYQRSDRILIQSRAFAPSIEALGADAARIRYFPNSAEALYQPGKVQAGLEPGLPQGFRVMFAGNIGVAQDFETILAAATLLKHEPTIHWIILGDGRQRPWVEREIEARGLQATFHLLGRHPPEAMPRFFARADAMLVTLRREPIFALTLPSKLQSYLASAKPIIAAIDGEGARVVTEAGAGVAVPAEDPDALANAVLRLARLTANERQTMGERGRAYFEQHFEREMLLTRLEGWMNEL